MSVGIEGLERRDCPAVVSIAGPAEVAEAGRPVTFTATLSAAQSRPVEVTYFTSGTATSGQDYRLSLGAVGLLTPSGTFTFKPGTTTLPIKAWSPYPQATCLARMYRESLSAKAFTCASLS